MPARSRADDAGQAGPRETERGGTEKSNTAPSQRRSHNPRRLFSTGGAYSWERQKGRVGFATVAKGIALPRTITR